MNAREQNYNRKTEALRYFLDKNFRNGSIARGFLRFSVSPKTRLDRKIKHVDFYQPPVKIFSDDILDTIVSERG